MVKQEVIRKRLDRLNENLMILEHSSRYSYEEFSSNPERYGSVERFLQLSIETINDIATHIISEKELGTVEASRDIPKLFQENGYINKDLEQKWIRMIGFRNILVHEYLDVDKQIVYEVLQNELTDIRELQKLFATFL